jgi:hypothetical protein
MGERKSKISYFYDPEYSGFYYGQVMRSPCSRGAIRAFRSRQEARDVLLARRTTP